jgi:hypothetical protein
VRSCGAIGAALLWIAACQRVKRACHRKTQNYFTRIFLQRSRNDFLRSRAKLTIHCLRHTTDAIASKAERLDVAKIEHLQSGFSAPSLSRKTALLAKFDQTGFIDALQRVTPGLLPFCLRRPLLTPQFETPFENTLPPDQAPMRTAAAAEGLL